MNEQTQWIFSLKDKLGPSLKGLKTQMDGVDQSFGKLDKAASRFKLNQLEAMDAMTGQFPMLQQGLALMTNPYVAGAAAVAALGAVLYKSVDAAAEFNNQFLELRNLNTDKSQAELERLKDSVLNA